MQWQLAQDRLLNKAHPEGKRITLMLGDYEHTTVPSESFGAVFALESSCKSHKSNKSAFLREAQRLLRPGGRIVVADGFLGPGRLRGPQKRLYQRLCECWVIETLGEIEPLRMEMERPGFTDIVVESLQRRVTLSVLHVPWVTLKFLMTDVLLEADDDTCHWNNILALVLLPFVGYPVGPMAYYIVSATRS